MYIAMFGPKGFTVSSSKVITFDEFSLSSSLQTESQESKDKKPSTYIKSAGLDTFSLKVKLDRSLGVLPMEQIKDWMQIKDESKPYPFLLEGKPLLNTKWLLKSVAVSDTIIDGKGYLLAATLTLSFEEFIRAGSAKAKSSSKKTKKKENTESIYNALSPSQKSEMTRTSQVQSPGIKPSVERM